MMHGGGMMEGWGMMSPLIWILMLLLWGFAILGGVCAVKWLLTRGRPGPTVKEKPLDTLKARYARGEISREAFVQMKKDLKDLE